MTVPPTDSQSQSQSQPQSQSQSKPHRTYAYDTYTFASAQRAETIRAYSWTVPHPRALVFLLHGFRSHIRYNFLRNDDEEHLHLYGDPDLDSTGGGDDERRRNSSFVRELNVRGLSVYGHDHVGHGESSGERAYFESFQVLVDDLLSHVRLVVAAAAAARKTQDCCYSASESDGDGDMDSKSKTSDTTATTTTTTAATAEEGRQVKPVLPPVLLCAHSMGGTVAITAAMQQQQQQSSDLFAGMALSSAATEPPADLFGLMGRVNYGLSALTSVLIPRTVVVDLPKNTRDPAAQRRFEADPLNSAAVGVRARVGRELIVAYEHIAAHASTSLRTPFLTAAGEHDTLVNPRAARRFHERAATAPADKALFEAAGRWHSLLVEPGYEEVHKLFADWLSNRASTPPNLN